MPTGPQSLIVRRLGVVPYRESWERMRTFTETRDASTADEVWLLEHPPIYTVGRNGKGTPCRMDIPLVRSDRGGDITYHGPGQLVMYVLLDLRRLGLGVKDLVALLESLVIAWLARRGIHAARRQGAPGVYVASGKIASLGLRIRRGCSYHGLSLNVAMDLAPFSSISPCGLSGVAAIQVCDLVKGVTVMEAGDALAHALESALWPNHSGYGSS
ncbi:MAG: lipoyl(octanoyl) transferase LipB [Acidiferrobacteraceae bacterium]